MSEERVRGRAERLTKRRSSGMLFRASPSHPHPRSAAGWSRRWPAVSRTLGSAMAGITAMPRAVGLRGGRPRNDALFRHTRRDPFEALADPTRRGILEMLRDYGVRTAGDIAEAFPEISRPAVSRHLRVLRESRIVAAEQVGREWRYRIDGDVLAQTYRDWFERFVPLWEESLARLKRQVESDEGESGSD